MKTQILYLVIILALFTFESYLHSAAARNKKSLSKQELQLENARLTAAMRKHEERLKASSKIYANRSISEAEVMSDVDLELGLGADTGAGRLRSGSTASESKDLEPIRQMSSASREDFVEFNRGISNNLNRLTDVHAEQTKFQGQVYKDIKYIRRTGTLQAVAAAIPGTIALVVQYWPQIVKVLGGGSHGSAPGAGTNSTGT